MTTAMKVKERPILFSAPMVRANLDGTKTQTRRIVKFSDPFKVGQEHEHRIFKMAYKTNDGNWGWLDGTIDPVPLRLLIGPGKKCPYGRVGNRLWVREAFLVQPDLWKINHSPQPIHYLATTKREGVEDYIGKPSIHMPRWASRIDLEISEVRVERLQDISEEDAKAEGVPEYQETILGRRMNQAVMYGNPSAPQTFMGIPIQRIFTVESPEPKDEPPLVRSYRVNYQALWEEINGPGSWDLNPWVWVIKYKRVRP